MKEDRKKGSSRVWCSDLNVSQEFKRYESIQKKLSGERYLAKKKCKNVTKKTEFLSSQKKSTQNIVQRCV